MNTDKLIKGIFNGEKHVEIPVKSETAEDLRERINAVKEKRISPEHDNLLKVLRDGTKMGLDKTTVISLIEEAGLGDRISDGLKKPQTKKRVIEEREER